MLVIVWSALHVQDLRDWYRFRNFSPSAEIARLAEAASLSDKGVRLFYVGYPEINEAEAFNGNCPDRESSIVLGCYARQRIYIFDVSDERLAGVKEVTAAHEMLHAAYERLSGSERDRINALLESQYERVDNPRIVQLIKQYQSQDPSSVDNELHSILGTEYGPLDDELEQYYSQYFDDRMVIVSLSGQYEGVFELIKQEIATYDEQLSSYKDALKQLESDLISLKAQITENGDRVEQERQKLDAARADNNIPLYNSLVPGYNNLVEVNRSLVVQHNTKVREYNETVEAHNEVVSLRNVLAAERNELVQSLDSTFQELEQ